MGTEQLNIRIPAELAAEFGRQVKLRGETKAAVVVSLLRGWVEMRQRDATRAREREIYERRAADRREDDPPQVAGGPVFMGGGVS